MLHTAGIVALAPLREISDRFACGAPIPSATYSSVRWPLVQTLPSDSHFAIRKELMHQEVVLFWACDAHQRSIRTTSRVAAFVRIHIGVGCICEHVAACSICEPAIRTCSERSGQNGYGREHHRYSGCRLLYQQSEACRPVRDRGGCPRTPRRAQTRALAPSDIITRCRGAQPRFIASFACGRVLTVFACPKGKDMMVSALCNESSFDRLS